MLRELLDKELSEFSGATITDIDYSGSVVGIKYQLNGENKYMATTPHCLLAALTIVRPLFIDPIYYSHKTLS